VNALGEIKTDVPEDLREPCPRPDPPDKPITLEKIVPFSTAQEAATSLCEHQRDQAVGLLDDLQRGIGDLQRELLKAQKLGQVKVNHWWPF
jgi:hypothetical protein